MSVNANSTKQMRLEVDLGYLLTCGLLPGKAMHVAGYVFAFCL